MILSCEQYLNILELLSEKNLFGGVTIYPAIGVDALPVLYVNKIVGMNWHPYNEKKILEHLSPILPSNVATKLKSRLENILTFISRIDVSRLDHLYKYLQNIQEYFTKINYFKRYSIQ